MDRRGEKPEERHELVVGRLVKRSIVGVWHGWNPRLFCLDATTSGGRLRYFGDTHQRARNSQQFTNLRKEVEFWGSGVHDEPPKAGPLWIDKASAWDAGQGGSGEERCRLALTLSDGQDLHFAVSCPTEAHLMRSLLRGADLRDPSLSAIPSLFHAISLAASSPSPVVCRSVRFGKWEFVSGGGMFGGRPLYAGPGLQLYWDAEAARWTANASRVTASVQQWAKKPSPTFVILEDVERVEDMCSPLFVWDSKLGSFLGSDLPPSISGNLVLDVPNLVRTLAALCAKRSVATKLLEQDVLPRLLEMSGWASPRASAPLLEPIVVLWKALGSHIRTTPQVEQAFARFLPSALQCLVDLEYGRLPNHSARAVFVKDAQDLSGWYVRCPGLHNDRPFFTKPFQPVANRPGDDYTRPMGFLSWSPTSRAWRVATALNDGAFYAQAEDDVGCVECVVGKWQVWQRPNDHSELKLVDNDDLHIATRGGLRAVASTLLPQAITHLCIVPSIGDVLVRKHQALEQLLDRVLMRTGGTECLRKPVAVQVDMLNRIFANPPAIVVDLRVVGEKVTRISHAELGQALFVSLQEGLSDAPTFTRRDVHVERSSTPSSTSLCASVAITLAKDKTLFRTCLELVVGLTGAALTEPIAKTTGLEQHSVSVEIGGISLVRGDAWEKRERVLRDALLENPNVPKKLIAVFLKATATKRMANLALDIGTVTTLLEIPISLRHSSRPEATAIQQQLVNLVTPRVLDLALEVVTAKQAAAKGIAALQETIFALYLPRLLESLADLCELPAAAEVVCRRDLALNTLLGVLVQATTTQRDALDKRSNVTEQSSAHPAAVKQLLWLLATLSRHLTTNEVVAQAVFRADPVQPLVRVMGTGASDYAQRLAAFALFQLAESSLEHRETAERCQAIPVLLQFLKTGGSAGQMCASFALEALLEDSSNRQTQFRAAGGVRSLVRLLEFQGANASLLSVSVQTIVVHLASLGTSAIELVEAGVVPALLKILGTRNPSAMGRAAAALLRMSFHGGDVRKQLVEMGVPAALEQACSLAAIDTPVGDLVEQGRLRYDVAKRARWQLADLMPQAKFWLLDLNAPRRTPGTQGAQGKHVMISYNWAHQDLFLKVKAGLEERGFAVWMDTEKMLGNLLTQMAHAVEEAFVVLLGMSAQYQASDNCRSEAEYARHLKRPCIPCVVEQGFQASGWLGLILGEKLYYDFSSPLAFQSTMQNLVREIEAVRSGELHGLEQKSKVPRPQPQPAPQPMPQPAPQPMPRQSQQPTQRPPATLNPAIQEVLERIGLVDELGPLLVDHDVDSLELLREFTARELNEMGAKWGHAKKLEVAMRQGQ